MPPTARKRTMRLSSRGDPREVFVLRRPGFSYVGLGRRRPRSEHLSRFGHRAETTQLSRGNPSVDRDRSCVGWRQPLAARAARSIASSAKTCWSGDSPDRIQLSRLARFTQRIARRRVSLMLAEEPSCADASGPTPRDQPSRARITSMRYHPRLVAAPPWGRMKVARRRGSRQGGAPRTDARVSSRFSRQGPAVGRS
jgi:hypothetical protein